MKTELTQEFVKSLLNYDEETGEFTWKERPREMFNCNRSWRRWNNRYAGEKAGCTSTHGYWRICINDVRYKAHRLAFLYCHGVLPKYVDHIDHDPANNRIGNLRGASHKENLRNQKMRKNNTSGVMGVYWRNDIEKWAAQIMVDDRCIPLGTYIEMEDAIAARENAERLYGFHVNHGKKEVISDEMDKAKRGGD